MAAEFRLKCHPPYFEAIAQDVKRWEIRINDRYYSAGSVLTLMEYDPGRPQWGPIEERKAVDNRFTGRAVRVIVERVWPAGDLPGRPFTTTSWVVLDIKRVSEIFELPERDRT